MRRSTWATLMLTAALTAVVMLLPGRQKAPVQAEIVTVTRRDIACITPLTGVVSHAGQQLIYAQTSGVVSHVYVQPGSRVAEGEALVRVFSSMRDDAASVFVMTRPDEQISQSAPTGSVIRAPGDVSVHEVLVTENVPVSAGMPVARVSSGRQEIVCTAARRDAACLAVGDWAWITCEGERVGTATITEIGAAEADGQTGRIRHTIVFQPDKHIDLPSGAMVDVDVCHGGSPDAPTLPLRAITTRGTVWLMVDGSCTEIPVGIVLSDELYAWVELPEGMRVAIGEFQEGQSVVEAQP